jgi:hypothetical protein
MKMRHLLIALQTYDHPVILIGPRMQNTQVSERDLGHPPTGDRPSHPICYQQLISQTLNISLKNRQLILFDI